MSTLKAAHLAGKAIIEISGPDAQKFLKGQTCRDVDKIGGGYSGFLNASGRVIHSVFILPIAPQRYLITYDRANPFPLTKLLPPFRLRSKVKFFDATAGWDVYATWGDRRGEGEGLKGVWKKGSGGAVERNWIWERGIAGLGGLGGGKGEKSDEGIVDGVKGHGCWDLRAGDRGMGMVLMPKGQPPEADVVPEGEYHLRRMIMGIPEGPEELHPGAALPLESCMDIQGGVDFRKGCYLGQELTVRTYHTGATRKRILPLSFFPLSDPSIPFDALPSPSLDPSTNIPAAGNIMFHPASSSSSSSSASSPSIAGSTSTRPKAAGKVLSQLSNVGLGMVRLEMADKSWWGRPKQPRTVGEWLDGPKLIVDVQGEAYGVQVGLGEAYGQALREVLDPTLKEDNKRD